MEKWRVGFQFGGERTAPAGMKLAYGFDGLRTHPIRRFTFTFSCSFEEDIKANVARVARRTR